METEPDIAVERACLKIKTWRKSLDKITSMFREANDIVAEMISQNMMLNL